MSTVINYRTQVGVSGYCYATSALLGTARDSKLGLPSAKSKEVLALGQELVETGLKMKEGDKMALVYISGGWALIGGFISLGEAAGPASSKSMGD